MEDDWRMFEKTSGGLVAVGLSGFHTWQCFPKTTHRGIDNLTFLGVTEPHKAKLSGQL